MRVTRRAFFFPHSLDPAQKPGADNISGRVPFEVTGGLMGLDVRQGPFWVMADGFPGLCWHLMRWHGGTRRWYSADSVDQEEWHVIGGGGKENRDAYQWRGLAQRP